MPKLTHYDQWHSKLEDRNNRNVESIASGLVTASEVKKWIEADAASYLEEGDALALLLDQGNFVRAWLIVNDNSRKDVESMFSHTEKPTLVEFSYLNEPTEKSKFIQGILLEAGFSPYTKERRYVLTYAAQPDTTENRPVGTAFYDAGGCNPVGTALYALSAEQSDVVNPVPNMDSVLKLWRHVLKPYQTVLPPRQELKEMAAGGNVITIGSADNPEAAMLIRTKGTTATFGSVAVHPDHRGKGLATQLYKTALANLPSTVTRVIAWVEEGNTASERLHERAGFIPDGNITHGFLKE